MSSFKIFARPNWGHLAIGLSALLVLAWSTPAFAHHALGGRTPAIFFEGFTSGLAHPVIGVDHFAFVVVIGLLSALKPRGIWISVAFALAAIAGTGLHLMSLDLPGAELFISASVLAFGLLLAIPKRCWGKSHPIVPTSYSS